MVKSTELNFSTGRKIMKIYLLSLLLLTISCSHQRSPASLSDPSVASESFALGNVKAFAQKTYSKDKVCFDISLTLKGVDEKHAQPNNWTVTWLDKKQVVHQITNHQRTPASLPKGETKIAPYGSYQEWQSELNVCVDGVSRDEIHSITLNPKELPYKVKNGMTLHWNHH
jgi:hypothetical protein